MAHPRISPGDIAGIAFALAVFSLFTVAPPASNEAAPAVPVIKLLMASRTTIFTTRSTEIFCVAEHDDGSQLTYTWSAASGMLVPSTESAVWFAPEEPGTYAIGVEVRDEAGAIAYDSLSLTAIENQPPTISALTAEPAMLLPGESAIVTCAAEDAEGHSLTYEWLAATGAVAGSGPAVNWTAPAIPGAHYIVVRVSDELGATRTGNAMVSVQCPQPPVIEQVKVWPTVPDYTKEDMRGGYRLLRGSLTSCELECLAATPYGDLIYEWTCTSGSIEGRGAVILFVPPDEMSEARVTVKVTDLCGNSNEAELLFWIYKIEEYSNEPLSNPGGCLRCLRNR